MENQRVRLSKQMLQASLLELLTKKNIRKISVREICDHAHINRTTFYKYYANEYDLLKAMENGVLEKIELLLNMDKSQKEYDYKALVKIATFVQENIKLCRILINNTVDSVFPERLLNLSMIHHLLEEQLTSSYQKDEIEYVYQFVVNGGFSILREWINKDSRESPERIAEILIRTIDRLLIK